ncbi:hypothetical protein [Halomonas salinarum]|uniref:hypothetical protein n=1 Tax=Halomonas salinarum TaxID=1158993 RepID=UPI00143AB4B9|nr:hypothetical protein [Halomonas salinarum]
MTDDASAKLLLRDYLTRIARQGETVTYRQVCDALGLVPPRMIQALARLLEDSMLEDAEAGRPFLAALVVSQSRERHALPAPGFFDTATRLGRFDSDATNDGKREASTQTESAAVSGPEGEAARRFHAQELAAALAHYG